MLSKIKKVKTDKQFVTRKKAIKITQKDIDRLNKQIRKDIKEKELEQERALQNTPFPRIQY